MDLIIGQSAPLCVCVCVCVCMRLSLSLSLSLSRRWRIFVFAPITDQKSVGKQQEEDDLELPPREQLCNRYCSNKHIHSQDGAKRLRFFATNVTKSLKRLDISD